MQNGRGAAGPRGSGAARPDSLDMVLIELVGGPRFSSLPLETKQEAALILLETWERDGTLPTNRDVRRALDTAKARSRRILRRRHSSGAFLDVAISFDPNDSVGSKEIAQKILAVVRTWPPGIRRFFLDVAFGQARFADIGRYELDGMRDRRQGRRLWRRLRREIHKTIGPQGER